MARGRLLLSTDRAPVPNARVFLADVTGRPLPGLTETRTDAEGRFRLAGVPATLAYVLVVEAPTEAGRTAQLRSIVAPGQREVPVTLGSTLAVAAVVVPSRGLGQPDQARLETLARQLETRLGDGLLPDLAGGPDALSHTVEALIAAAPALRTEVETLRAEASQTALTPAEMASAVTDALAAPDAGPSAGANAVTAVLPTPSPDATATPTPGTASPPGASSPSTPVSPAASAIPASPPATPTAAPTAVPTTAPTASPTAAPTPGPTPGPTPSASPSSSPSPKPSPSPVLTPSPAPTYGLSVVAGTGLNRPQGLARDAAGTLYVADTNSSRILKVTAAGAVSTLAGGTAGYVDGTGAAARFSAPQGIALGPDGNLYVADTGNQRIRKVTPTGVVTTLAGSAAGAADGTGAAATFSSPRGLAVAWNGTIYVADAGNHRLRVVSAAGVVTTLAGSSFGLQDGVGAAAKFNGPAAVAVHPNGSLLVADAGNARVRIVTVGGRVFTLSSGVTFSKPVGVAVDAAETIFVADEGATVVHRISTAGTGSKIGGSDNLDFRDAIGLPLGPDGSLYMADTRNNRILRYTPGI
jgi:sugar lactone lactonase YvrE